MKLTVLDQIMVNSVQADVLRPGTEIDVDDALGAELLAKRPGYFEAAPEAAAKDKPTKGAAGKKAARAPRNKAAPKSANKSKG